MSSTVAGGIAGALIPGLPVGVLSGSVSTGGWIIRAYISWPPGVVVGIDAMGELNRLAHNLLSDAESRSMM